MKQATLFKAWHAKGSTASEVPKPKDKPPDDMVELSDEDDEFLVQAMDATLSGNFPSTSAVRDECYTMQKALEQLEGFDAVAGQTWIYPTNYPVRSYQFNIVQSALFKNTMVILPTGLGKTFIAAVVMYNFYRWYPTGKIVFMAPTRPLVAQQIEACYKIMGIPLEDTLEMTGTVPAGQRAQGWRERRVFFLTPQVMMNDLLRNALRPQDVKCLVIDEAHKALGSYSYCQVVQEIVKYNNQFRILALSATPGTDVKAVRSVLANLMISHVELRTEGSLDIQEFTQKRTIEKVVVPLGEEITELKNKFLGVIRTYLDRLDRSNAIPRVNPESLGKYRMLLLKESFQQNPPSQLSSREVGQLQGYFSLLISLYHAFELLLAHGMQPFFYFLKGIVDGEKSQPRVRYELMHNGDFEELYKHLEQRLGVPEASANDTLHPTAAAATSLYEHTFSETEGQAAHVVGHPKLAKLEEVILEHFKQFAGNEGGTRVMVFSQYRDSVKEITVQLNRHQPLVKAMNFVGQRAGTAKGFSQKEQLLVVKKFREGGYNVLVSTCVGEEGLDIGEIDLIVCFDAPKSPIRLVQRMGRTGRKREGRIVVLLTEGKEEQAYKESNYKKQNIHRAITSGRQLGNLYEASPRMVPRGINPVCHRMHMTVPEYRSAKSTAASGRGTRSILNFITGKQQKKSGGALNKQEELYYEAHFEVALSTVVLPPVTPSRFLSLRNFPSKQKKTVAEDESKRPRLSLSNWTQWQCDEQRSRYVAHSSKTKMYVALMRFIENTRYADDELDAYSLELKPFLQMEYVISSDERLSLDPDLVGTGSKDGNAVKTGRRKKFTKKTGKHVVADNKKSEEETDVEDKDYKHPDIVASPGMDQGEPEDTNKIRKKKKKRRVITDFFKDKSLTHDSSSCISFETDLCERVEEMDCWEDAKADEDCVVVVSSEAHDIDMKETDDVDTKDLKEEELEPDLLEVEIRTPPRLDVDIFPSPGHVLSPVDMAKIVLEQGEVNTKKSWDKPVSDLMPETMECGGGGGVPDMECPKSGTRTKSSEIKFSKLEVDSDLEDLLEDDCFDKAKCPSSDDHSLHEEPLRTAQRDCEVEETHSKVDNRKGPVPNPIVISPQDPISAAELGKFSEDLFDTKCDKATGRTDSLKLNDEGVRPSSPILILSQKLVPPAHSTPRRTIRTRSIVDAAKSPGDAAIVLGDICEPSPIRGTMPECMDNSDWNLLGDSDIELFENASDGHISDISIHSGGEGRCEDMGITELCDFIEENSVAEEARDGGDPVSRRSLSAERLPSAVTKSVATRKPTVSCNDSRATESSSANLGNLSAIRNKTDSCAKSLLIKGCQDSSRSGLKVENTVNESTSRMTKVESCNILKEGKDLPSIHTSIQDKSSTTRSFSAGQHDPDPNQSSASKRPSFEITVDWSDFDSGSGSDEPATTVKTSTQTQKGRTSLSSTMFNASGMTQSRNIPVALVKPIMCSTANKTAHVVSSGDDSPVQVRRHRPCQKRILSQSSTESESSPVAVRRRALGRSLDDSDDDFQVLTCKKQAQTQKRRPQKVDNKMVPQNRATTRKKPKQSSSKKKNNFIEREADVSADVVNSSDESENSSLDQLDESFIDDQTQVPNKTLYLQTVRSPVNTAKFKIGHANHVRYSEVFSQAVSEDEADYVQDSFCVGSDDSSALHQLSSSASEKLEEELPVRSRVKTRQRKRTIQMSSTSEEESCRTNFDVKSQKDTTDSPVSSKHQGKEFAKPALESSRRATTASEISGCALADLPGSQVANSTSTSGASRVLSREERLRLQKIRQEEFRRTHMASLLDKTSPSADAVCQPSVEAAQVHIDNTITIIVDTREIASGTALVSALRASKNVQVEVFSLSVGSLVVGRRCCVLRKALADFGNPQNNSRLVAEVRHLFELYDRPCIILERPQRVKPGERPFKRTKYFDNMLMFLNSTHAKVFFSGSQANTAELVLALAKKERQKGMALASPECLQHKNHVVQFYLAFPKVSLATAISLTSTYPSVCSLVKSSVEEIQERLKIPETRAKAILDFCNVSAI
ncbi:FA complementation group M isoform X2 [Dermacentor variabilis]|uniref:FA complementation group M isoform X2 n=1 Tax=Dermacentor variabilis TaxID=34621 RepID=UPI003F5C26C4